MPNAQWFHTVVSHLLVTGTPRVKRIDIDRANRPLQTMDRDAVSYQDRLAEMLSSELLPHYASG